MNFNYVFLNYSNFIISFLKILKLENYISNIFIFFSNFNLVIIKLKYFNKKPCIKFLKRISKSNLKIFKSYKNIPKLKGGLFILSTNKGLLPDNVCRNNGIGGEIVCYVF